MAEKVLSVKEARASFSELIDKASRLRYRFIFTKNGAPKATLMSAEEYESWVETLEFLSHPRAMRSLERGLKDARAGRMRTLRGRTASSTASWAKIGSSRTSPSRPSHISPEIPREQTGECFGRPPAVRGPARRRLAKFPVWSPDREAPGNDPLPGGARRGSEFPEGPRP